MEVDYCFETRLYPCPRDGGGKPMSDVMDDRGSRPHPRSSGLRVSTKSKAPSPPALKDLDSPGFSQWFPGNPHLTMDQKENLIDKDLSLVVVLPGGVEKMTTVHGSKPLMDLLVTLCATYHLNPSNHTLELVTANRNNIKLKPSALIGTLDAERIILKPKGEDKNKKANPIMPEATVRMVINYKKTQKTILRVNPRVPLAELLPAICEKCEFDTETTVLLRDVQSLAPLDLGSSLNDYAIREVYARDTKGVPDSPGCPASPTLSGTVTPGKDKIQKEKENKGLFSKFRKSKKNSEQATTVSAPASPVLVSKPRPLSMALPSSHASPLDSPRSPTDGPKKRRAPPPPILVSQSNGSDIGVRQRLNSEPICQVDGEQTAALSRGSSAESSLKRTKRKAPPPPSSPGPVITETPAPPDEDVQASAATVTLEEIKEQEETSPSVTSPPAGDAQGDDGSLSSMTDSLPPPPPPLSTDMETWSTMAADGSEEDQTCDLSSDGNELQSVGSDEAPPPDVRTSTPTDVGTVADAESSDLTETNEAPGQAESEILPPIAEESSAPGVCSSAAAVSLPPPVPQEVEAPVSDQAENTDPPGERSDRVESSAAISTSRPAGEDAEVQTDFTRLPDPPQQDGVPEAPSVQTESPGKRDMATLTEEVDAPDPAPSAPAATKAANIYATDSEPKPKPSNELTRDYIPKVGMTTYTIVPQKSLEKLRYFEVALTLETPATAAAEEATPDIGSLRLEEAAAPGEEAAAAAVPGEEAEPPPTVPGENSLTSTATAQDTVNAGAPASDPSPGEISTSGSQPGSPAEVKDAKIPPATKPKPGSFRLPQHKKSAGYYVTSAAEKATSPGYGQKEAPFPPSPPPPPPSPPLLCQEATAGGANVQLSPRGEERSARMMMMRQSSLQGREPSGGLSLEKLRTFAAPRPYSPSTPSRFAQAVSSAVKRSQSLSFGPKSPQSPPLSPSHPALSKLKILQDGENQEVDSDQGSSPQGAEAQLAPSLSGAGEMEGASGP